MQIKQFKFSLDRDDARRLQAMVQRLRLPQDEAMAQLIMAAVDALEPEQYMIWPLFLTQAGVNVDLRRSE